jgi:ferrous iron transport protein A
MSISRELLKARVIPNANSSHLQQKPPNPILGRVNSPDRSASPTHSLAQLGRGQAAIVQGLAEVAGFDDGKGSGAALLARLRDLGFIAGARCEVVARMWLGGDPLVVRVGGSTFALRRAEAAAVRVSSAVPA